MPGASPEVVKKEKAATSHTSEKKKEKTTISSQATNQALPETTQKNKINQPHIRLALSRADTLAILKSAPKRKRSGITPDSCGKAGDPHNLDSWRVERLRLATLPYQRSAVAISMPAGTSLPKRLAAAPTKLSSLLEHPQPTARTAEKRSSRRRSRWSSSGLTPCLV